MPASLPTLRCRILALCLGTLLFAQLGGLHFHQHFELGGDNAHGAELHFVDAGLHVDETGAAHAEGLVKGEHPHIDIDSDALKSALLKALFGALLLILPPTAFLRIVVPPLGGLPRPQAGRHHAQPSRFRLKPPAQAPPHALVTA